MGKHKSQGRMAERPRICIGTPEACGSAMMVAVENGFEECAERMIAATLRENHPLPHTNCSNPRWASLKVRRAHDRRRRRRRGARRPRSHCRFVSPLIHFIPDSLTYSVPPLLKRQCDRTPGARSGAEHGGAPGDRHDVRARAAGAASGLLTQRGPGGSHRTPWRPVEDPLDPL